MKTFGDHSLPTDARVPSSCSFQFASEGGHQPDDTAFKSGEYVEPSHQNVPNIFRTQGPNRNAVVYRILELVRDAGCSVRVLAGKVFDRAEYSVVAEVSGDSTQRAELASAWVKEFRHETDPFGRSNSENAGAEDFIGTHLFEVRGSGESLPFDFLDLVSAEFHTPINIAYVRRSRRANEPRAYCVQIIVVIRQQNMYKALVDSARRWAIGRGARFRVIPLVDIGSDSRVVTGTSAQPQPPHAASCAHREISAVTTPTVCTVLSPFPDGGFGGGVDLV